MELSLDSPRDERKKEMTTKPSAPTPSLSAVAVPQSAALEEVHTYLTSFHNHVNSAVIFHYIFHLFQLEEVEEDDKFDILVSVKDPEKIG